MSSNPPFDAKLGPGDMAGDYAIVEAAAQGGFATIYRARHRRTQKLVAVKVLQASLAESQRMRERFRQEATTSFALKHPNIVDVFEVDRLPDGRPFIAMEWLDGQDLAEMLRQRAYPFDLREAVAIVDALGAALSFAHQRGVVHRDVKAANIMAVPRDEWFDFKLLDFGIAKLLAPADRQTKMTTRTLIGSPLTMAPEQILNRDVDARTDIYALGLLLFQLLTRRLPFESDNLMEVEQMHLTAVPPRVSEQVSVPRLIDEVVARCLEKEAVNRYPDVASVVRGVNRALRAEPPRSTPRYRETRGQGIGLLVQLFERDTIDACDPAVEDAWEAACDLVELHIKEAGLSLVSQTVTMWLALTMAGRDDQRTARELVQRALELDAALRTHISIAEVLRARIVVHGADVILDQEGAPVDGPLLRLGDWPEAFEASGVFVSAVVLDLVRDACGEVVAGREHSIYRVMGPVA